MQRKVKIKNLIVFFLICISLIISLLLEQYSMIEFVIVSIISFSVMYKCVKHKNYLFLIFIGIIYELFLVMNFLIKVVGMKETSWRVQYAYSNYVNTALSSIAISLMIFSMIYYLLHVNKIGESKSNKLVDSSTININKTFFIIFSIFCLIYILIFIRFGGFLTKRIYGQGGNSVIISFYRMLQSVFIILYFKRKEKQSAILELLLKFVLIVFVLLDLVIGIKGYRFILVECILLLFCLNMDKIKKIKLRYLLSFTFLSLLGYVLISIIRIGHIDSSNILESFFRHERNIFYSLVAVMQNRPISIEANTYIHALVNIIPTNIGRVNANTGQILLRYIQGNAHFQEGITMGGFYLTEAYYNYGSIGGVLISTIMGFIMVFIEYGGKKYNNSALLLYFFIAAEAYNIIYYGSSNYIKITVYYIAFIYLFFLGNRILFRNKLNKSD